MKTFLSGCLATLFAASALLAAPADDIKAALGRLKDKPNYSWTAKTEFEGGQFTPPPVEGKAEKDGFAMISVTFQGNTVEAVVKGEKGVVKTDEGWKTEEELSQGGPGGGFMSRRLLRTKPPVAQVEDLLKKIKELSAAEGAVSGSLTEEGAKELLTFGRRPRPGQEGPPPPKNAKGTVKFWVKDGLLTKYELGLQGTVTFGQNQEERDMKFTTTIELKDVGATKVTAPEEAKKKLAP